MNNTERQATLCTRHRTMTSKAKQKNTPQNPIKISNTDPTISFIAKTYS
jgi:hypothetical protein